MLCPACHRRLPRSSSWCRRCGTALVDGAPQLAIVLPGGRRVPLLPGTTVGRASTNTISLDDPSVSRVHAKISGTRLAPIISDAGSSAGTWLDGHKVEQPEPLTDGSSLQLGDTQLRIERPRDANVSGLTSVVPAPVHSAGASPTGAPRLRPGHVLKRLGADGDPRRWVLQDAERGSALRLDDRDAAFLQLINGERPVGELLRLAEQQHGPGGPARLAALLTALADHDFLGEEPAAIPVRPSGWAGAFAPRRKAWRRAPDVIDALYRRGGWRLLSNGAIGLLGTVAAVGLVLFVGQLLGGGSTPFSVAQRFGIGGLVFIIGRFLVAGVHEIAHGLALSSYGRRVRSAGIKLVLIFPYLYVDTSEVWLESRPHRIVVSAAGPLSDLVLGAVFSIAAVAAGAGTLHDVFFQLALAAYVGAVFNLNPFVERDGYHVLTDMLRQPRLKAQARAALDDRLRGKPTTPAPGMVTYALLGVVWSGVVLAMAVGVSLRVANGVGTALPPAVVNGALAIVWALLVLPIAAVLIRPLAARRREAASRP